MKRYFYDSSEYLHRLHQLALARRPIAETREGKESPPVQPPTAQVHDAPKEKRPLAA